MANYKETVRTIKDKDGNVIGKQKCIIADVEHLTPAEEKLVQMYMKSGEYKVIERKNRKKSKGNGLTKAKIETYLKENDKDGFKEYQDKLKAKENYMRIMVWFKKKYPNYEDIM